jgi:hypothetical protein
MNGGALPAATPACRRLAEGLRGLRARTSLSLAALAERTPYSKSSWERYLNGKQLAPRQAVEVLCAMAGEPPGRLIALWELADLEWSGRARSAARPAAGGTAARPDNDGSGGQGPLLSRAGRSGGRARRRTWAVATAVGAAGVAVVAVCLVTLPGSETKGPAGQASSGVLPAPGCHGQGCAGEDPGLMGCAVPGRVRALGPPLATSTGARLEVRYSSGCGAAWARMWHAHIGDTLEVSVPGDTPQRIEVADSYDEESYLFTPMVDGSDFTGLRVCFRPARGGSQECFQH